ncbi:MAG: EamA family transporter [Porticoccaceae bacterium]|jgi:carboxylate/amino acid/amine transporter|nr:EamA family transporter [Porticoccaceae bacterium]
MLNFRISPLSAMGVLWLVTAAWAFSFSLIGVYLSGHVDSYLAVFIRVGLAFLLFLPLLRPSTLSLPKSAALTAIGGIQIGATYLLLYHAFSYLSVPEVLLFTIFTPLYITLFDELILGRRRLPIRWWIASVVAVIGAAVIRYNQVSSNALMGFLLIQAANLCFAAGQVAYKRLPLGELAQQPRVFGWFFLGATLVSGIGVLFFADWSKVPSSAFQWGILIWLGLGASGLGYLAWNMAAKKVNTGQLASMNNMMIPAGILVNFLFWNDEVDWLRLLLGGSIIGLSLWICSPKRDAIFEPREQQSSRANPERQ